MGKFFLDAHLPGPLLPPPGVNSQLPLPFPPLPSPLFWSRPLLSPDPPLRCPPHPHSRAFPSPAPPADAPLRPRPAPRARGPSAGRGRPSPCWGRGAGGGGRLDASRWRAAADPPAGGLSGRRPAPLSLQVADRTTPLVATFRPPLPGQAGSAAYVQSWLKEKQLSAASTPPGGPSAASASMGGSTRGSRKRRPGDSHLSSPLAPAPRAGSPAPLRPSPAPFPLRPAPPGLAPPLLPVRRNRATERTGS